MSADLAGADPFASLRRFWWVILLYGLAASAERC